MGALVVHELRYRLAFGGDVQSALAESGRGHMTFVTPVVALVAMLAVATLVQRLAGAAAPARTRRKHIWLAMAAALFGIFCAQEVLEGLLATGHPGGIDGIVGDGGWLAAPLALAVAAIGLGFVKLAARAASMRGVATALVRLLRLPAAQVSFLRPASRPRAPLARHLAGRAPPLPA
jgi:hypothetical protein